MPKLRDAEQRTYVCPTCQQRHTKTRKDVSQGTLGRMFSGVLPAFIVCGRCLERRTPQRRNRAPLMWGTDVPPQDRRREVWGRYGGKELPLKPIPFQLIRDVTFGKCRRFVYCLLTDGEVYDDPGMILQLAEEAVEEVKTVKGKCNAIAVHFYRDVADAQRGECYAVVDYAPEGRWEDADTVDAGRYNRHQFNVVSHPRKKRRG